MPVRAVVTGAQGFLGRHLVRTLLARDAEAVLGLGRSPRSDELFTHDLAWLGRRVPAPLPSELRATAVDPRYSYTSLDLGDDDVAAVLQDFHPTIVIHAAAALRDEALEALLASNVLAAAGLAGGLGTLSPPPRLVMASSGSVYGAAGGRLPFHEDGPAQPIDLYGVSKRAAEDVCRVLAAGAELPLVLARIFNLIGPGLQDRHLPAKLAAELAAIGRGLAPPRLQLGPLEATRDFIDVRDAAAALVVLADAPDPPAVVNIGCGVETPVLRLLDLLAARADVRGLEVERLPGRRSDIPRAVADVGRLQALGFSPSHPLDATLGDMLAYFDTFSTG